MFVLVLTIIAAWMGGGSLYITNDVHDEIELFYKFIRYSVNLLYMMVPLYFVLYYVVKFIEFNFIYGDSISRKIVPLISRSVIASILIIVILHILWIYRCAESACPVFWKSPVRTEEITVPDR